MLIPLVITRLSSAVWRTLKRYTFILKSDNKRKLFIGARFLSSHRHVCQVTGKNVTILVAGRLFADEHLMSSVNSDFQRNLKNYYNSDIAEVPFIMDPKKAWEEVNDFVENKTEGVIKDFMNR